MMNAEEYLKSLSEHDSVFDDGDFEFTERQLIDFAERFHQAKVEEGKSDSEKKKILTDFAAKISKQEDCPAEFLEIVDKNINDLLL